MILIKGGYLIDPASGKEDLFDLLLDGGVVRDIRPGGEIDQAIAEKVVDASKMWVVPGLVDIHVHLREPGFEWKETVASGAKAAALGGYTAVCSMPNTDPVNDNGQVTEFILEKAAVAGLAKVYPIGAVSVGLKGKQMAPLAELRHAGCAAFSDDGEPVYDAGLMRRALEWSVMLDMTIACHEEEKSLTCGGCMNESAYSVKLGLKGMPGTGEDVMVARDIELARLTGGRVHFCHVSTARSIELIRRAKSDGINVTCEVTPHHLLLTEECIGIYDTNYKMSPPLREPEDLRGLREGLSDGTIDAIASDHAPHEHDSKMVEFQEASFGIIGLQTNLPLVLGLVREGVITRQKAVELLSTGPARVFGINGGKIEVGKNADITVIDPGREWIMDEKSSASLSKNTPFYGKKLTGKAEHVFVDGHQVVESGEAAG